MNTHNNVQKRLAIVRLDNAGDFLLWLNTACHYRSHFKNWHITLIVRSNWVELAGIFPFWDVVIPARVDDLGSRATFACESSSLSPFDMLINTQFSRIFWHDAFIHTIGAKEKIAVDWAGPNLQKADLITANGYYQKLLPLDPVEKHEVERNFEILNRITGVTLPASIQNVRAFLHDDAKIVRRNYIVMFPGAASRLKSYPWPRFVEIANYIHGRYGIKSILCGTENDQGVCQNIACNARASTVDLSGQTSLIAGLQLINGAQLVISNDSMAAHAAVMLDINSICFLGGGYNGDSKFGRFLPYPNFGESFDTRQVCLQHPMTCFGCYYHCKYDADCYPCIEYIPIGSAFIAIDNFLKKAGLAEVNEPAS